MSTLELVFIRVDLEASGIPLCCKNSGPYIRVYIKAFVFNPGYPGLPTARVTNVDQGTRQPGYRKRPPIHPPQTGISPLLFVPLKIENTKAGKLEIIPTFIILF